VNNNDLARRTEIAIKIDGKDISGDINKYLISMTFTDNEEDATDDLRIELDDREGNWLEWLKSPPAPPSPPPTARFPYHVIGGRGRNDIDGNSNVYGWVTAAQLREISPPPPPEEPVVNTKGARISAVIIQKNFNSDSKDIVLDCGEFEITGMDARGGNRGSSVSLKATSLPHSSTMRTQKKSRTWENIRLSAIAADIAKRGGMKCMFESAHDPLYARREQLQISDISFLQGLCQKEGISLK
jgi:hypothetical protein